MNYQNIRLDKSMYKGGVPFSAQLEKLDPSQNYAGTELAGLDAFQRQLKRFDIKVSGAASDSISKFFGTGDSAALFPEYVQRAVMQGADESAVINSVIASKTVINSLDYRTIATDTGHDVEAAVVEEGGAIPQTVIKLKDNLVRLTKRGRMLVASYEAIKFQRIDLFTVTLKQIGAYITRAQLKDAVDVLINGDSPNDANGNKAEVFATQNTGTLTYDDLLNLWSKFEDFRMNTMIVSPDMMQKLLTLSELRDPTAGLNFSGSGMIGTPFGASVIKSTVVPEGTIVALDKNFALEMVTAGDITVDYDKLIDSQLERAAVTSTSGFAKIFPEATKVLRLKTA
ncbi:MAG: phage major capsid protein [Ruminococcaceae bacterium]|nr:phage major capsid protein [Oscillospiraceae bacterium]